MPIDDWHRSFMVPVVKYYKDSHIFSLFCKQDAPLHLYYYSILFWTGCITKNTIQMAVMTSKNLLWRLDTEAHHIRGAIEDILHCDLPDRK
ncbi:MAG: hypothetical protein Ta2B_04230 [Termitinemataceae bacterium]|nr:MAG: hypothetical protein Ta2B_04230 [Termitinemataceae bacterium]